MTFASKWYIASRYHLRIFFFCFSFAKEKADQTFGKACLCDKAAGCRFSQAEWIGALIHSAQTMMTKTAVSAALAVGSRRSRIRLAERTA